MLYCHKRIQLIKINSNPKNMNILETFSSFYTKNFSVNTINSTKGTQILKEGDHAPMDIELKNPSGEVVTLKDYNTKKYLVVYFYPKDGTYSCTVEACEVRDLYKSIRELDVEIVGVSKDNPKSHMKFITKHSLNFRLLSDENHRLIEAFGIWVDRKYFSSILKSTQRSTFIVNKEGIIVKAWQEVVPAEGHAAEILEYLKTLN